MEVPAYSQAGELPRGRTRLFHSAGDPARGIVRWTLIRKMYDNPSNGVKTSARPIRNFHGPPRCRGYNWRVAARAKSCGNYEVMPMQEAETIASKVGAATKPYM